MKLTEQDKKVLLQFGHTKEDLAQIERAANKTVYKLLNEGKPNKRPSRKEVLDIMDRRVWLSGLSRSAFHWTAVRQTKDGRDVMFDSRRLFK